MALYLGIASEKTHDESVTIVLAIGLIAASILLLRTLLGNNVYRNRFVGYLNSSFYYNLLALSLARLYCQNSISCQKRSSIISIALAFILFALIVAYHVLCTLLEIKRLRRIIFSILHVRKLKIRLRVDPSVTDVQGCETQEAGIIIPTSTEVSLASSKESSDSEGRGKGMRAHKINKISTDGEHSSPESEETVMNEKLDIETVCKQTIQRKGKQSTNSNTLRVPLLDLRD